MITTASDVVVIGAGAVGASVAYELALAGATVRVVDQATRPAAGCSRANAGLLVPSHSEPLTGAGNIRTGLRQMLRGDNAFHVRPSRVLLPWLMRFVAASNAGRVRAATRLLRDLGLESLQRHAEYLQMGVETSFERQGMVDVFASHADHESALCSLERNPLGLEYDVLGMSEVHELVPGIIDMAGGVYFRNEAHCDSRIFVESTLAAAERLGVKTSLATRVRSIRHKRGRISGVKTSAGFLPAGAVVVAAGHQSVELTKPLGIRLPITPAKGYVIDIETRSGDSAQPVGLKEDMVVITPYRDRLRIAGTLELVGADTTIDQGRVGAIRQAAVRAIPRLGDRRILSVWGGTKAMLGRRFAADRHHRRCPGPHARDRPRPTRTAASPRHRSLRCQIARKYRVAQRGQFSAGVQPRPVQGLVTRAVGIPRVESRVLNSRSGCT